MKFNYWFDKAIVLSQPNRIDRRNLFRKEAERIGLEFEFFDSIPCDNPIESFNKSHIAILGQLAGSQKDSTFLVLEDDAVFQNMHMFNSIMNQLWNNYIDDEPDFDMLYLGANLKPYPDYIPPVKVDENLYRVFSAYTTHAIVYRYQIAQKIIANYNGQIFDVFLNDHILRNSRCYICSPFLSVQRPGFSGLWNRDADYTDIFMQSEDMLNDIQ
jgi:hypothetical protein